MKHIVLILAALALSGCSSFRLGAVCYVPYGVAGQCSAVIIKPEGRADDAQKPAGTGA